MDRRQFVKAGAAGGLALLAGLGHSGAAGAAQLFGPLGRPDRRGVALPAGFTSRVIAVSGVEVARTGYRWHPNPDGGATFATPAGGWIYVSNSETSDGAGGVSMVRFDAAGEIIDAGSILAGSNRNCAGGPTPWGTWLSCEEVDDGRVWECDPLGEREAVIRPAMGVFNHEAAAADPDGQAIYLTEDKRDGALYRFVPDRWGDLSAGVLEVMTERNQSLQWQPVPDPSAASRPTREQLGDTKVFAGGEGAWFGGSSLYFTTKGDNRVWRYTPRANTLDVVYDIETSPTPVLSGVDNVTMSSAGDLFVCEDGGNMEVVVLTADGGVQPFARIDGEGSEVTGVAFDPSGTRMYVSSQRNPGETFEITGPFRGAPGPSSAPPALPGSPAGENGSEGPVRVTSGATDPMR